MEKNNHPLNILGKLTTTSLLAMLGGTHVGMNVYEGYKMVTEKGLPDDTRSAITALALVVGLGASITGTLYAGRAFQNAYQQR